MMIINKTSLLIVLIRPSIDPNGGPDGRPDQIRLALVVHTFGVISAQFSCKLLQ